MAAAFRKLLSSEPLCVGTRNEDQEIVIGSTGNADGESTLWKWMASRRTCRSHGYRVTLRVSALLKTITSFLDLEVSELVRWQNWGRRRDSSLCLLTSFESDDAF